MRIERIVASDVPEALSHAARNSSLLVAGYDPELIGYLGLIDEGFFSTEAYIWLHLVAPVRPIAFGRAARRFIGYALDRHPRLIGHCIGDRPQRWLHSLGANFIKPDTFEIVR